MFIHSLKNFNPFGIHEKCKTLTSKDTVLYSGEDYGVFGRLKGVPYVHTYHGNWPHAMSISITYFLKGLFHVPLYYLNFKAADQVIVFSHFGLEWVSRFTTKVQMIRNGVCLTDSHSCPQLNHPSFITVGRIDDRKGKLLVEVIHHLIDLYPDELWYLYIVGPILYSPLEKYIDGQKIFAIGFQSNAIDYVREADVFLLASSMENLSLAVTEALAIGKPVVCFDVGALGEVVTEKTGVLITRFDTRRFAQEAYNLLIDKEQKILKGQAAKLLMQGFNWDKCAEEYLKLFYSLIQVR
jgi:glycosyltransferase involved in cell wall biosynthesis